MSTSYPENMQKYTNENQSMIIINKSQMNS